MCLKSFTVAIVTEVCVNVQVAIKFGCSLCFGFYQTTHWQIRRYAHSVSPPQSSKI